MSPTAGSIRSRYARDEDDEFVAPTRIGDRAAFADGDAVLFMNFRADRARQLTQALTESNSTALTDAISPPATRHDNRVRRVFVVSGGFSTRHAGRQPRRGACG